MPSSARGTTISSHTSGALDRLRQVTRRVVLALHRASTLVRQSVPAKLDWSPRPSGPIAR